MNAKPQGETSRHLLEKCHSCRGDGRECDCTPAGCLDRGICRDCGGDGKAHYPPIWVLELVRKELAAERTRVAKALVGVVDKEYGVWIQNETELRAEIRSTLIEAAKEMRIIL